MRHLDGVNSETPKALTPKLRFASLKSETHVMSEDARNNGSSKPCRPRICPSIGKLLNTRSIKGPFFNLGSVIDKTDEDPKCVMMKRAKARMTQV